MESNSQSENPENDVKKKTQNATRKRRTKTEKENAGKGKKKWRHEKNTRTGNRTLGKCLEGAYVTTTPHAST